METLAVSMNVPKESKEMVDLLEGVAMKAKAGAEVSEYMELIGKLSSALEGVEKMGDEAKSDGRDEIVAYLIHKIMPVLMPVKVEAEAQA